MIQKITIYLAILSLNLTYAQEGISDVKASLRGKNILIEYNLNGVRPNEVYTISLFSSADNFNKPLSEITGDYGPQKPGKGKSITWRIMDEIGGYTGDIRFKVVANLIYNPVRIMGPANRVIGQDGLKRFKAGKEMKIEWTGGGTDESITLNLFRGDSGSGISKVIEIGKVVNTPDGNTYDWTIPKKYITPSGEKAKMETGQDYFIQISGSSPYNEPVKSYNYYIKRPSSAVPLLLVAGVVIGGGYYLWSSVLSNPENPDPNPGPGETDEDLPFPPFPNF